MRNVTENRLLEFDYGLDSDLSRYQFSRLSQFHRNAINKVSQASNIYYLIVLEARNQGVSRPMKENL